MDLKTGSLVYIKKEAIVPRTPAHREAIYGTAGNEMVALVIDRDLRSLFWDIFIFATGTTQSIGDEFVTKYLRVPSIYIQNYPEAPDPAVKTCNACGWPNQLGVGCYCQAFGSIELYRCVKCRDQFWVNSSDYPS